MPATPASASNISNDTIAEFVRQYRTQKRKCEEENGVLRNIVKRAKAEGINTKSMIAAVNATKLEPDVVTADLRDTIRYMNVLRIPLVQSELFEGMEAGVTAATAEKDDLWDAGDQGYRAGRNGVPQYDCPFEPGSPLDVEWRTNWRKGQAAIAREMGENVTQASADRARPERGGQPRLTHAAAEESKPKARRKSRSEAESPTPAF